jgi:hypothetical protein
MQENKEIYQILLPLKELINFLLMSGVTILLTGTTV